MPASETGTSQRPRASTTGGEALPPPYSADARVRPSRDPHRRIRRALRTGLGGLTAALLAGGGLTAVAAAPAAAGTSTVTAPAHDSDPDPDGGGRFEIHWEGSLDLQWENDRGHGRPNWGTVISDSDLNLRSSPYAGASRVGTLPPGAKDRVSCRTDGGTVHGNSSWYWLSGARAWAASVYVETERRVPEC
ncbi:hypothetical protein DSC45_28990 [Streptomyces sp. YIM 130001]|uniref:SH3 domain-containing protein n=1 Tax=Streptomyces sp. YIM 130001 TaxID=2259644 RepID=UPI000ED8AB09|nr:SH3 domain-containing protein [Streptomyces sp. YIM 130001]RII11328.1 hypothetical protein DSC45_28990 [Streptomyces sp. YIM 130001]